MKKILLFFLGIILQCMNLFGQSSSAFNIPIFGNYLGWDNTSTQPLDIVQEATQPIFLYTSGGAAGGSGVWNNMRMRIFEDNILAPNSTSHNVGRVGIMERDWRWNSSPIPASLLHLGEGWPIGAGGHRIWMDVGTYTCAGTDMMYTGLKLQSGGGEGRPWTDNMDAVINWGDNNDQNPDNLNDLRFIYTVRQATGLGDEATNEGLEVMRACWNGHVGIGSFRHPTNQLTPTRPARRLEVIDRRATDNNSFPQLRLTFEPTNDPFAGTNERWTDFETTNTGDLFINPQNRNGNRMVGINRRIPGNTLEINSNQPNPSAVNGSGLRFTDLNSTSPNGTTAYGKVLTVDSNGDVVLTDDISTNVGGMSFCPGGTPSNYLMKYTGTTTACSSAVYEHPTLNYLGVGTTNPGANFHSDLTDAQSSLMAGKFNLHNTASSNTTASAIGVDVITENDAPFSTATVIGVRSTVNSNSNQNVQAGWFESTGASAINQGVYAKASGANTNYGVHGYVFSTSGVNNYGVKGLAEGATSKNYGVWAVVSGSSATNNWGLFAEGPGGNSACSTSCTSGAAMFNGDVNKTGFDNFASDLKFKQGILPILNAKNLLSQLQPKSYEFNNQFSTNTFSRWHAIRYHCAGT